MIIYIIKIIHGRRKVEPHKKYRVLRKILYEK
jgi:hypothetical protein